MNEKILFRNLKILCWGIRGSKKSVFPVSCYSVHAGISRGLTSSGVGDHVQNIYIFNPLPSKYYFSRENISEVSILMMVDRWGWGSQLIPVLNFGYFPQQINDEINNITEEFLTMVDRLFWQTRSNFPHCRIWTW